MFDVLIVGAGMVGASLACALGDKACSANRSLKVGIIEGNGNFLLLLIFVWQSHQGD